MEESLGLSTIHIQEMNSNATGTLQFQRFKHMVLDMIILMVKIPCLKHFLTRVQSLQDSKSLKTFSATKMESINLMLAHRTKFYSIIQFLLLVTVQIKLIWVQ